MGRGSTAWTTRTVVPAGQVPLATSSTPTPAASEPSVATTINTQSPPGLPAVRRRARRAGPTGPASGRAVWVMAVQGFQLRYQLWDGHPCRPSGNHVAARPPGTVAVDEMSCERVTH